MARAAITAPQSGLALAARSHLSGRIGFITSQLSLNSVEGFIQQVLG